MNLGILILFILHLNAIESLKWQETFENFPSSWNIKKINNPDLYYIKNSNSKVLLLVN